MRKKLLKLLVCMLLACVSAFCWTACGKGESNGDSNASTDTRNQEIVTIYNQYVAYAKSNGQTPMSYEDWLASIKGEKGETGAPGKDGQDGKDGIGIEDIYLGEDGCLYVKLTGDTSYRNLGKITGENNNETNQPNEFSQDLAFEVNSDRTGYAVSGVGLCLDKDIKIPNTHLGKPVTEIKYEAFYCDDGITSVSIPNSVTFIDSSAFSGCDSLTRVEYTGTIDQWAQIEFNGGSSNPLCYAKNLYINGELVTEVELTTATKISNFAFYYCSSLTSIVIPDSVTSIGYGAFWNCESLQYNEKDGLKYLGNETNKYLYLAGVVSKDITTATIDNNCKFIGSSAFEYCSSLTSIVIPDSVTSIGSYAFEDCLSLRSIVIPDSVTSIGSYAFAYCSSLTSIEISNSVTSIGEDAFEYCSSLTSVTIGNSVTSIGDGAFFDCSSLTSIVIPNSVTSIGYYAFRGCSSLTSVTIGSSVTSIGYGAFYNCSSLTSIVIPNSVTSIGYRAFYGCSSLTSVTFKDTSTWYRTNNNTDWQNKTGGTETDVTTPSINVTYLTSTYYTYYWYKK